MPPSGLKFKLNQPHVIAEKMDDEVIAINLQTGSYYTMAKSGAFIWELVNVGATFEEMLAEIHQCYSGDPSVIEQAVRQFLGELEHAQLIAPQINGVNMIPSGAAKRVPLLQEKFPFERPLLCEHNDMQELLLLDPIHEISRLG